MITVTEYESLGKGKLRVRFDNEAELILYRGEVKQWKLREEAQISEEEYQKLLTEVVGKRAKKRAMHLLERMDRTEKQLRDKLEDGKYPQVCIDEAIAYVRKYHYIDDYRYACTFIRYSQEKMSRLQLKMKLAQKGVPRDLIDRALEEEYSGEESVQIARLLEKRKFVAREADDREFQRTYQYLLRRGFRSSDILRVMKAKSEF